MLGWGWRCPDAHRIFSVNSVMPQALSESPAIDPREDGSRNTECSRKKHAHQACGLDSHPATLSVVFPYANSIACWIQKGVQTSLEILPLFFFFVSGRNYQRQYFFLTSIYFISQMQSGTRLWEAMHQAERLLLRSKAGWQQASCQHSLCSESGKGAESLAGIPLKQKYRALVHS